MEILNTSQYNQAISKYKLLSSTAGVGSIITTKMGYYVLVSDINKWQFVKKSNKLIDQIRSKVADDSERYKEAKERITQQLGVSFVDDKRFIDFLRAEKDLPELVGLVAIPSLALNENTGYPDWKNHPINKFLEGSAKAEDFMIMGTHFPKWFKNKKNELKKYDEWKARWLKSNLGGEKFVPPRDAKDPIKNRNGNIKRITIKNKNQGEISYPMYRQLEQLNLILICPNGHLSDIPWPKYLRWQVNKKEKHDVGEKLFQVDDCCPAPKLQWTESKNKSEGYGSIYIECKNCKEKTNLEGINNIRPSCMGEKPWAIELGQSDSVYVPKERCEGPEKMQVALVTGNNIYYANGFASLYVPQALATNRSHELVEGLVKCNEKFQKYLKVVPNMAKKMFWEEKLNIDDFIIDNGFSLDNKEEFSEKLRKDFLQEDEQKSVADTYELYRWQEYRCFANNDKVEDEGLFFCDIEMPKTLNKFFSKIQQMEELKLIQVQLDFTRVRPRERVVVDGVVQEFSEHQNIFSDDSRNVFVLPANETFGEGLFFQFDEEAILLWQKNNSKYFQERFKNFFEGDICLEDQGAALKQKIKNNCYKHYLVHSFSHMLMRELEFSCGYPTASLKERLYISERMAGVLIYTAEGSEGSMGGVVWQGEPDKLTALIKSGLRRAVNCSSDPLCWETGGQGVFELNYAACFSCLLVSETACEEMNLGLDRRVLVDEQFGFFKEILSKNGD